MHYHAEVWVPMSTLSEKRSVVEEVVSGVLSPYDGNKNPEGFWDWWQIGGRWTAAHNPDYDPRKDPRNIEVCGRCHGTERQGISTCKLCDRTGKTVKWPIEWAPFDGDIASIGWIRASLTCHTLVLPGEALSVELINPKWNEKPPEMFYAEALDKFGPYTLPNPDFDGKVLAALEKREIRSGYLVTVDYHN